MRTLLKTMWAALWLLVPTRLLAQGTSPWVDAVNELQTQFTGAIARASRLARTRHVQGRLARAHGHLRLDRTHHQLKRRHPQVNRLTVLIYAVLPPFRPAHPRPVGSCRTAWKGEGQEDQGRRSDQGDRYPGLHGWLLGGEGGATDTAIVDCLWR